jgi:membrane associated rhomboid family serine protease
MSEREDDPKDAGDDEEPAELRGGSERRWGTVGLVVVNLAFAVVMAWAGVPLFFPTSQGGLVDFGAVEPTRIWGGELWRLLTGCFVHVAAWHLLLNLWVLWMAGRALERLIGTARFVLVYVASGIFGFALSVALAPGLTAGASGAIFGVTGGLLAIALLTRHRPLGRFLFMSFLPFVVGTFALGLLLPFMNNVAHFGGFALGFVFCYGLHAGDRSFVDADDAERVAVDASIPAYERWLGPVALVLSLALFGATTLYAVEPRYSPRYHAMMGLRALHTVSTTPATQVEHTEAQKRAKAHVDAAVALAKDDAGTHLLRARALEEAGDTSGARAEAARAFARFDDATGKDADRYATFDRATLELGLVEGVDEEGGMPWPDGYSVRLLCDAALEASTSQAPLLKNACAWLFLRAREPAVRDAARALTLAAAAWTEAGQKNASVGHTYACALAHSGNAAEGLALLELLDVKGDTSGVSPAFLRAERARLAQLAQQQSGGK